MGFLTDTAEQRKRVRRDPQDPQWDYSNNAGMVQVASPNVPAPEGMVTGQAPTMPALAGQTSPQQPAQLPPAAVPGSVVTPMFAPTTSPAQYQNLKQNYERAGMQAPPPPQPTATPPAIPQSTGPTGYKQQLDLATAQRKQATNARYLAAGKKAPYPEAMQQAPGPLPPHVFGTPTGDSNLDDAISADKTMMRLQKEHEHDLQRGKTTPEIAQRNANRQVQAEAQRAVVTKTYQAEKQKKDDEAAAKSAKSAKDAETTQRSIESHQWAQESHAAGEDTRKTAAADKKRNQDMSKLLGAAQDAAKDGRFDDAEKAAEAGQKNANTPAEAAAFNAIRKEVQDAKTVKAAAAFLPQVTAAKTNFAQAERARTAELSRYIAFDKSFTAAKTKYELYLATKTQDEAKEVEAQKAAMDDAWKKVELSQAKIYALIKARDDAQSRLDDLTDQHAAIKSGQASPQAPAGTQTPAKPASQAEYDALPSGTKYVHRDGSTREKK